MSKVSCAGVKLYRKSWKKIISELEQLTLITTIEDGYRLSDTNGVWIYLIEEGITHFNKEGIVDNIIIRDPRGYGFFVFTD